jgi:hypothetical protein
VEEKVETFNEIRERRIKEFDAKLMQGTPIDDSSVWPWWLVRIWELKDRVKELEKRNAEHEAFVTKWITKWRESNA